VKKLLVTATLAAALFTGSVAPAAACGPADNWSGCGQKVVSTVNGWGQTARKAAGQYARTYHPNKWVLPSGASKPLQGVYDAAGRLIKSQSR